MNVPQPIVDAVARELSKLPAELGEGIVALVRRIGASKDPREALGRAAQVLAHEQLAETAMDALFEAKRRIPGSGV